MIRTLFKMTASVGALMLAAAPVDAHTLDAMLEDLDPATLGEVDFTTSCSAEGQAAFDVGLLLLHHMMYRQSDQAFRAAAEADPDCAMAQWGIAMTNFHPLWPGGPTPDEMAAGKAAVSQLSGMEIGTERERAYAEAVRAFYAGEDLPFPARLATWAEKQRAVYVTYPDDL